MVDAWLIVVIIIVALVMVALNIYLFIIYCHPDDLKFGAGWFAKVVFMLGSAVTWGFILLLPLDIANSRGSGGGLNIGVAYAIFFILYLVFLIVFMPMALFIYESDDEKPFFKRFCCSFVLEICIIIIVVILAIIAYSVLKTAIVCDLLTATPVTLTLSETPTYLIANANLPNQVTYSIPAWIFPIIFLEFLGWFLFVVFGGIGLTALPMDLIIDFIYRPRPRKAEEIAERKIALRRRTEELMEFTKQIEDKTERYDEEKEDKNFFSKWSGKRKIKSKEKELTAELYKLEEEFEIFEAECNLTANPLWDWFKLFLGIILGILSFVILLHIILNVLAFSNGKPVSPFLNTVFVWLEFSIARFVSTIFFTFLTVYILLCVVKGNIKFGLRLFFLIKIHPMKVGRTYMNSFLFNGILILFCVPATIHFQVILFQSYMVMTASSYLFTVMIQKMKFFTWFFNSKFFIYFFVAWVGITFIYLLIRPKSDRMNIKKMIERRKKIEIG